MRLFKLLFATALLLPVAAFAQANDPTAIQLNLAKHAGELTFSKQGWTVTETLAKDDGTQALVRAVDRPKALQLAVFLFAWPEQAPLNAGKCRDEIAKTLHGALEVKTGSFTTESGVEVATLTYLSKTEEGFAYNERAFAAKGDLCGDIEFSSARPLSEDVVKERLKGLVFDAEKKS